MAIPQHYQNFKVVRFVFETPPATFIYRLYIQVYEHMNQALLRDGLLARSFGAEQASLHFENLLNTSLNNLSVCYDGSSGCFFLRNDALGHTHVPVLLDYYAAFAPLVIGQYYWYVLYFCRTTTVSQAHHCFSVRQPRAETDRLRYVQQARLELTIFLRHAVGQGLGLLATDAIAGDCTHIRGWNEPAPLGEKACIHLRIEVRTVRCRACASSVLTSNAQWPGGAPYNRRVPTRDQTRERRPITLQRFLLQVGRAVEEFLQVRSRYFCGSETILRPSGVGIDLPALFQSWSPSRLRRYYDPRGRRCQRGILAAGRSSAFYTTSQDVS